MGKASIQAKDVFFMRTLDGSKRMTYNKCIQDTQQKRDAEETSGNVSRESAAGASRWRDQIAPPRSGRR